jgi:hypothetical protein
VACLVVAVAAVTAAAVIGISDHPPGIALLYLGSGALLLAVVHRWRRVQQFARLLVAGVIGFPVLVVLHNAFYALAELCRGTPAVTWPLEALHAGCFIGAVIVCPTAVVAGVVGCVATLVARRRGSDQPGSSAD